MKDTRFQIRKDSHISILCYVVVFLALQPIVVVFSQPSSGL